MNNRQQKSMNQQRISQTLVIPETEAHCRLDQALSRLLPTYSRTQIKAWIDQEDILVNGKPAKASAKVRGREKVTLETEITIETPSAPENMPLDIIYEDEDIIVINKPAGMVVHPGAGNQTHTLLNALLYHYPDLNLLPRAGILHRIDKNTSGLLLIAKNSHSLKYLAHLLKKHEITREYQAIVYGSFISGGTINAPIDRDPLERKRMAIVETGKEAITHYRILKKFNHYTLLSVQLETGRTHQIRVHMSHIKHPLVGDSTYGGRVRLTKGLTDEAIQTLRQFKRQALHACRLTFLHPTTEEEMEFTAPAPDDFQTLLSVLT